MDSNNFLFLESIYKSYENNKSFFSNPDYFKFVFKSEPFINFDYCKNYSLCFSANGLRNNTLNTSALFTILDQKVVQKYLGISITSSLYLSIKCEYLNRNGSLSSYTYNVILDHVNYQVEYVNNISVNLNGTALLLCSNVSCFVANTPYELSKHAKLSSDGSHIFFTEPVYGKVVVINKGLYQNFNVVKASWNPLISNSFVIVTNECVTESFDKLPKDFFLDLKSYKYMSFIRIYNLENGLDNPVYELSLNERLCRLGKFTESDKDYKFQSKLGKLVDFYWNSNQKSALGSFALFVMSNYGYVFCYCPIVINNLYDLNRNTNLIKKCFQLYKKGFKIKSDVCVENKTNDGLELNNDESEQMKTFISYVTKYLICGQSGVQFHPLIIRLVSDDFVPDCNLVYSYPTYESFVVVSTNPLVILASQTSSGISVFVPNIDLYPSTTSFYHPSSLNKIVICKHKEVFDFDSEFKFSFKYLSHNQCVYYSRTSMYYVTYHHRLFVDPILVSDHANNFFFYSDPLLIKEAVNVNNNDVNLDDVVSTKPSNILIAHQFSLSGSSDKELLDSLYVYKFNEDLSDHASEERSFSNPTSMSLCSMAQSPQEPVPIIRPNTEIFDKINSVSTQINGYKEIFNSLRLLNEKKDPSEKSVEIMKGLSKLHSDVLENLQSLPVYEKAVDEYVNRNGDLSVLVDNFFNDTIDQYHTMFNALKAKVEKVKERHKVVESRHSQFIEMLKFYKKVKSADYEVEKVSNMISEFHLRYSSIILNKVEENFNSYEYDSTHESNMQLMIDEWFLDTYKENVDLMYKIFAKIKTIKSAIDSLN